MNSILMIGTRVVVLALIFYSVGIFIEQRKKVVSNAVLIFLNLGLFFDIMATAFMVIGSPNSPFTLHGFIGYSALLAMLIDIILMWNVRIKNGKAASVPKSIHIYSRFAYIWWVLAFITGSLLVIFKNR